MRRGFVLTTVLATAAAIGKNTFAGSLLGACDHPLLNQTLQNCLSAASGNSQTFNSSAGQLAQQGMQAMNCRLFTQTAWKLTTAAGVAGLVCLLGMAAANTESGGAARNEPSGVQPLSLRIATEMDTPELNLVVLRSKANSAKNSDEQSSQESRKSPEYYTLGLGDELRIEFLAQPDFDRSCIVQPDGTITLPLVGSVRVAGSSLPELSQRLESQYGRFFRQSGVTVSVLKLGSGKTTPKQKQYKLNLGDEVRLESLTDPKLNRQCLILPDGTITLPLIGQVKAVGLTLPTLSKRVEKMYAEYYQDPAITISVAKLAREVE